MPAAVVAREPFVRLPCDYAPGPGCLPGVLYLLVRVLLQALHGVPASLRHCAEDADAVLQRQRRRRVPGDVVSGEGVALILTVAWTAVWA